jgi:hypothetical protein
MASVMFDLESKSFFNVNFTSEGKMNKTRVFDYDYAR